MKVSIQFQYMPNENRRPIDGADHNDPIEAQDGQLFVVPDVGDTVSYESYKYDYGPNQQLIENSGRVVVVARKVKTRHFSYDPTADTMSINIVVVDVPEGEMPMRLKE